MMERITKQMELIHKELQVKHGVGILRQQIGEGNHYEYVFIETPVGHTSNRTRVTVESPTYEEPRVRQLIKRIMAEENA